MVQSTRRKRTRLEAAGLAILGVILGYLASVYELHETLDSFAHDYDAFAVDQLFVFIVIAALLGFVFGMFRIRDLRQEVARRQQAESLNHWMARHDTLTGLNNRQALEDLASSRLDMVECYAVLSIDLVGFKKTNDLIGHQGGDELLVKIARRLEQVAPPEWIYRLGGDEFVILCERTAGIDLDQIGRQLIDNISIPVRIAGTVTEVGANLGYACYPEDGSALRDIIRRSDIAMYAAKKIGRNNVLAFEPSMDEVLSKRLEMENALLGAVRSDSIVPFYQPLIDLTSGRILAFEALARWQLPGGEFVPPAEFIPLAEEAGLITALSEQVFRHACRVAATWPDDIQLAFNLSPTQLTDKLLGLRLLAILNETGLAPHRLELEITESALILNATVAEAVLEDLRKAGIGIALDDFGTGYSSFAHLLRFKFDKIKIDRSFVEGMASNEKHHNVIRSILDLSRNLGIPSTAEGIETDGQYDDLRSMGCAFGQGFLFSKAIPAENVRTLLLNQQQGAVHRAG